MEGSFLLIPLSFEPLQAFARITTVSLGELRFIKFITLSDVAFRQMIKAFLLHSPLASLNVYERKGDNLAGGSGS